MLAFRTAYLTISISGIGDFGNGHHLGRKPGSYHFGIEGSDKNTIIFSSVPRRAQSYPSFRRPKDSIY